MPEPSSTPRILHQRVSVRRGRKVVHGVATRSLIRLIREGRLRAEDEISADEKRWVRLDRHHQLAPYCAPESALAGHSPPGVEENLAELSVLLKELNR